VKVHTITRRKKPEFHLLYSFFRLILITETLILPAEHHSEPVFNNRYIHNILTLRECRCTMYKWNQSYTCYDEPIEVPVFLWFAGRGGKFHLHPNDAQPKKARHSFSADRFPA